MTSVFASRRRAEEFDSLVEAPDGPASRDARYAEFLGIVEGLRGVPASPEPRPEFVRGLREELMAAADTLLLPADTARLTLPPRSTTRDRRLAAAIGGFAVVGATASMAVASQSALPGEMLYPLKRAIEDARTGIASDRDSQATQMLDHATGRLDEVAALSESADGADADAIATTLVDFTEQATAASELLLEEYEQNGQESSIRELRDFTSTSMDTLEVLERTVPDTARDELIAAAEAVSRIDARAEELCPSCGGAGIDQIPPVLLASGAVDDPGTLVIPRATPPREGREGRRGGDGSGSGPDDNPLTPVVTAPGGGRTGGGTDTGPLDALTDPLNGSDPTASNPGGPLGAVRDGLKEAGDKVKETVDDTVGNTVDDATEQLDDTVDDLTDPLTGD
ncbi:DUF5667 domain-containing protein [Nocardioides euryhalodurans]|uniref:DUF5667 domain-containing protein n=1 Tax=Nocardioides euryhalodurans TaxID=2518370 RepID=A0A4V1BDW4_9ACTN|nr:DUF5667 domain-containing protein [Nocardioides euryhalodurans]QBR92532.1 hypothetical protein EXE57_09765 [Nocardioides euryhalodurans]